MNTKAMVGSERGQACRTIVRCTACWVPACMYFLMCLLCVAKAAAIVTAVQPSGPPVASTLPQMGVELFPPSALSYDKSLLAKVAASKQSYTMTTRSGSKYSCYLPPTDQDLAKDAEGKQKVVAVPSEEELLAPLQNTCLYRLTGWWTYELCHGRTIRQFHSEGEKTTAEFLLGKARVTSTSSPQPSKAEQKEEEKQEEEASNPEQQQEPPHKEYYLERFEGGTICDLTGAPRTAEVHWHCAPGEKVGAVLGLKEPFTCHYVFSVGTSLLCAHPSYRSDSPEVHTIACIEQEQRPLDDKVEVEGENVVMQEEAEVAEKKTEPGAILSSQDEEDQKETNIKEEKTEEEVLAEIDFIAPPPWEDREDEDIF